jgi:NAD(P)-dependent dehydrogenase (short-subunit alcohol dehydrogenase family)
MGILRMGRAFAPVLKRNGGGAMLNVLSVASWVNRPQLGLYGTTKSAAWGLTNSLRHELRPQGTQVVGMHVGFVDTDLTRGIDQPKSSAAEVVGRAFDALEAGQEEVLADERTRQVKRSLGADASAYLAPA